ncbi:MAG: hypothetical protein LC663_04565 [Actinobacteria bacterium]|nr:hypothetical protein [Actinomycetota bacterium]
MSRRLRLFVLILTLVPSSYGAHAAPGSATAVLRGALWCGGYPPHGETILVARDDGDGTWTFIGPVVQEGGQRQEAFYDLCLGMHVFVTTSAGSPSDGFTGPEVRTSSWTVGADGAVTTHVQIRCRTYPGCDPRGYEGDMYGYLG